MLLRQFLLDVKKLNKLNILCKFCTIGNERLEEKLRILATKVADEIHLETATKKSSKQLLLSKLNEISKDTFCEATNSQYNELLSSQPYKKEQQSSLSRSTALRRASEASKALRKEVFSTFKKKGMSTAEAVSKAEIISNKSFEIFSQKSLKMIEENAKINKNKMLHILDENETKIKNFILNNLEIFKNFDTINKSEKTNYLKENFQHKTFNGKEEKIFGVSKNCLNIFDVDKLKPNKLKFWDKWDTEKALIVNQGMGARNIFEEQIEWTKQGKMWPYPINNEYMIGAEANVSFVDHIFLHSYWSKHKVPKSKSVDQFMELVLVGLSKNPYMPIEKKRDHIDWFANYFKKVIVGKYKDVL